jgi:hypothetical protein
MIYTLIIFGLWHLWGAWLFGKEICRQSGYITRGEVILMALLGFMIPVVVGAIVFFEWCGGLSFQFLDKPMIRCKKRKRGIEVEGDWEFATREE